MLINLRQFFETENYTEKLDYEIDFSEYELFFKKPFLTPVKILATISKKTEIVTLKLEVSFKLNLDCDRCATEFEREFEYDFEHTIVKSTQNDNDEYIIVGENSEIDLDELILADILLQLPTKILCDENCKGICDGCGKDLNNDDCECKHTNIDPRLQILGTLLDK